MFFEQLKVRGTGFFAAQHHQAHLRQVVPALLLLQQVAINRRCGMQHRDRLQAQSLQQVIDTFLGVQVQRAQTSPVQQRTENIHDRGIEPIR